MNEVVPRKELERNAYTAIGGVGGGIGLLALRAVAMSNPIIGAVVGGGLVLAGLGISKTKEDRTAGMVATGAGIVTGIAALTGIGSGLMTLGGLGLLGLGGWSVYKFLKGMKSRQ